MERIGGKIAFAAISLALAVAAFALAQRGDVGRQSFKAFYCAGAAVRERSDPYRVEPLRSCERRLAPSAMPDGFVEPAPLPGYALVPFAFLAALPPKLASELFAVLLVIAAAASAHYLAAIVSAPRAAVLVVLAPLTLLNVAYGEIPPLAMLGTCAAAYFITQGRWAVAGFAIALALLQPNVGFPAALAMFAFAPRARAAIALTVVVLGLVSLAALGPTQNVEYFAKTLPLMAQAEIVASDQYSISHVLYAAGMAAPMALTLSKIWLVVITAIGVLLAGVIAVRHRQPELLPLLPPAAVLWFGIYLHDIQMLLALPAAMVLAFRIRGEAFRVIAGAGLALLTAVWTQRATRLWLLLDAAGVATALYLVLPGSLTTRFVRSAAGAIAVAACLLLLQHAQPPPTAAQIVTHDFHSLPSDWAATAWGLYLRSTPALLAPAFDLKVPTWIGLSILMLTALRMCVARTTPDGPSEAVGFYANPIRIA